MPGFHRQITPGNILLSTRDNNICLHPEKSMLPHALFGFARDGYPLYWEKTGMIGLDYHLTKKIWTVDDFIQMHVR